VVGGILVKVGLGTGGGGGTLEVVPLQPGRVKTRRERKGNTFRRKSFIKTTPDLLQAKKPSLEMNPSTIR
jgi:hypothetical protein